jgi:hypothetical protein
LLCDLRSRIITFSLITPAALSQAATAIKALERYVDQLVLQTSRAGAFFTGPTQNNTCFLLIFERKPSSLIDGVFALRVFVVLLLSAHFCRAEMDTVDEPTAMTRRARSTTL